MQKNINSGSIIAPPPEGVVTGEDIPRENEFDEIQERAITMTMNWLKQNIPSVRELTDKEVERMAIDRLNKMGVL